MQLSQILSLTALAAVVSAVQVTYDPGYDIPTRSMNSVACSNGENGLITRKGWNTQGEIPIFPYLGGAQAVTGWNSPNCGTCWKLDYQGRTVNVIAVDFASNGFNVALEAMNVLTNGQAVQLGVIDAQFTQIDASICGM